MSNATSNSDIKPLFSEENKFKDIKEAIRSNGKKEKGQKDNQRSTKHFPAPHMAPVVLLLLQNRWWGKDRIVIATTGTYPWPFNSITYMIP